MTDPLADYISVPEAARQLGVSRARVHQLILAGRLTPSPVGSIILLKRSEVAQHQRLPSPGRKKRG
jgi:excisionase family DNA binding protein